MYTPPKDEHEALQRFFQEVYHLAVTSENYHKARASGGMIVGLPAMTLSVASQILRAARDNGLNIDYSDPDLRVQWNDKV